FHKNLLARILQRPGSKSLPESPGEAINRFKNDVEEIPLFALWMNDLMGTTIAAVFAIVAMLSINVGITLIALVPMAIVLIIASKATAQIEKYRRLTRETTGRVVGFISESFGAAQAVKIAGAETRLDAHFRRLNDARRQAALKDRLFEEILRSVAWNIGNVGTGIVLILTAQAIRAHTFSVGDFAMFVFYLGGIAEMTGFLGFLVARYKQAGVSVDRMQRLMQGAPVGDLIKFGPVYERGALPEVAHT